MLDAFSALENGVFASEVWKTDEVLAVVVAAAGNEVVGSPNSSFCLTTSNMASGMARS